MPKKKFKPIPKFKNEDDERDFWATADTFEYFDAENPVWVVPADKKVSAEKKDKRHRKAFSDAPSYRPHAALGDSDDGVSGDD